MAHKITPKSYFDTTTPDIVLRSLFSKYDTDNDGCLSVAELPQLLENDLGLKKEDAVTYALLLDKDASSTISFEEFSDWIKSGERLNNINDKSRYFLIQKAVGIFRYYDGDGSGGLDRKEFKKLHADVGGNPALVDEALEYLDGDGNGYVSFYEFLKWLNWVDVDNL